MKDGWFDRLVEEIEGSKISYRKLSVAAGRSINYVQQMIKNKKQPGIEHLLGILEELGNSSAVYVITGLRVTPEELAAIKILNDLKPRVRSRGLAFLASLEDSEDSGAAEADRLD